MVGVLRLVEYLKVIEGRVLKPYMKGLNWSPEDIEDFVKRVRDDAQSQTLPLMCNM